MGTIGGNIANGSPIGDTPPPLIALGATLTLRRGKKRRTIPLEDFFIAYGKQDRQPGEFVEAVHVPVPAKGAHFAVHKITKRRDEDITAALGAFHLTLAKNGTVAVDPHRLWRHGGDAEARQGRRGGAARQAVDGGDGRGGDRRDISPDGFHAADRHAAPSRRIPGAGGARTCCCGSFARETTGHQGAGAGLDGTRPAVKGQSK